MTKQARKQTPRQSQQEAIEAFAESIARLIDQYVELVLASGKKT